MSIVEELEKEIATCNEELRKCNENLIQLEERKTCYTEKKAMLENLLKMAADEPEKTVKTKTKPVNTEKPEQPKRTGRSESKPKPAEETSETEIIDGISTKDLADSLNVPATTIAKTCNDLGFNLTMRDSKYILSKEQAEEVRKTITQTNT